MIDYTPLWILLAKRKLQSKWLKDVAQIDKKAYTNIRKNEYVSLKTLEKIALALDVQLNEIVEIIQNEQKHGEQKSNEQGATD